jgi:tight adherence protein C
MYTVALGVTIWLFLLSVGGWLAYRLYLQVRSRQLVFREDDPLASSPDLASRSWPDRYLFVAGFRSPYALPLFVLAVSSGVAVGGTLAWTLYRQGVVDFMVELLVAVPGGVGDVFLPLAWGSPWLTVLVFASLPILWVRAARRRRVMMVEQDLPITLDLLAALAEAGLGFDTALERILDTQPRSRPLFEEFRIFRRDVMAGRPRIESLRLLGQRLDVTWFTIFISALIQAERLGAGLADVLRTQADDLRSRRRERALAFAMALPSQLVLPLIVCFLPGIAIVVLGPTFHQVFQVLDQMFQQGVGS